MQDIVSHTDVLDILSHSFHFRKNAIYIVLNSNDFFTSKIVAQFLEYSYVIVNNCLPVADEILDKSMPYPCDKLTYLFRYTIEGVRTKINIFHIRLNEMAAFIDLLQ